MTIETLLMIILWVFLFVFFAAIILTTFLIGRATIKDNPDKGLVFVKSGNSISKPFKAKKGKVVSTGCYFTYAEKAVFIPKQYSDYFFNNRRMIFVKHLGQLIASPFDKDIPLSTSESESLIYELVASHIGADSIQALKGKTTINLIIIAIVAFIIGAIIAFGITQYMAITAQQGQQEIEKTQTEQKLIEVE